MEPMYECLIEIFDGVNIKVIFTLNNDCIEVMSTYVVDANDKPVKVDFNDYTIENFQELIQDELDSLPFKDSTVKFIVDSPN